MNYLPSASALDRAVACPASVVLPRVESDVGEAAHRGTHCHKYLELRASGVDMLEALAAIPEQYRDWCSLINVEAIFAGIT